jgi:hypothetical protein
MRRRAVSRQQARPALDLPAELTCPITTELFVDPVFTSDGQVYERKAIERWLQTHETSPLSGEVLDHKGLTPAPLVRGMCRKLAEEAHAESAGDG